MHIEGNAQLELIQASQNVSPLMEGADALSYLGKGSLKDCSERVQFTSLLASDLHVKKDVW
jgi:hypothetical protein